MERVRVTLGPRSYDIAVGDRAGLPAFVREVCPRAKQLFVAHDAAVTPQANAIVAALEAAGWRVGAFSIPSGEASLVMVPTTLLAMVDSSVGGKVGVNHPAGKNLIGAFHQPAGVWIDPAFLDTLPRREYASGLGEVVKYGVILDPEFFAYLEAKAAAILARDRAVIAHVVARCCRLKADVVELDEREETGLRAKLNYGHTFAHAYETVAGYGTWLHGEAVSAGMVAASRLAERLARIPASVTARQHALLTAFGLPTQPLPAWGIDAQLDVMRRDKTSVGGELRFVLPTRLGEVEVVEGVPEATVREILAGR